MHLEFAWISLTLQIVSVSLAIVMQQARISGKSRAVSHPLPPL